MSQRVVVCQHCRRERTHKARGLCQTCYSRMKRAGELDMYERVRGVDQVDRFDWVVVERLLAGRDAVVHPSEREATARELVRRGMDPYPAGEVCGMSGTSVRLVVAS